MAAVFGAKVRGLAETNALFDRLPADAREQLGVELAIIGREWLADQRARAPRDTGELEAYLSLRLMLDDLKVRVGMLGAGKKYGGRKRFSATDRSAFYGPIVAFGRSAQTVVVTRRQKILARKGNNRNGNTRRTIRAGKPYKMKVRAMAARDFIRVPGAEQTAIGQLAEFWGRLLAKSGAGG